MAQQLFVNNYRKYLLNRRLNWFYLNLSRKCEGVVVIKNI